MTLLETIERIPDRLIPSLKARNESLYLAWRELCHVVGSILLIVFFDTLFSPEVILIIFFILVTWMTYQEFYLHPKKYNQPLYKGILDWFSWIIPFVLYFILI